MKMDSTNFTYWLHGFFEISDSNKLTEKQVQIIKDHLALVFDKVTPDRNVLVEELISNQAKVTSEEKQKLMFEKKPFNNPPEFTKEWAEAFKKEHASICSKTDNSDTISRVAKRGPTVYC